MVLNVYLIQNQVMLSNGGLSASRLLLYFRNGLPAFEIKFKCFHVSENNSHAWKYIYNNCHFCCFLKQPGMPNYLYVMSFS